MSKPFSIRERIESFRFALSGLKILFRDEHNARIHLAVAVLVIVMAFLTGASKNDWQWLMLSIALVLICEAFNSAIEYLCDLVSPDHHPLVAKAKDISAAAVLMAAIVASMIGLTVFLPLLF